MTDRLVFDLETILAPDFADFVPSRLHGCIPEVTVGSEILAALAAVNLDRVDCIVGPFKLFPQFLQAEATVILSSAMMNPAPK